MPAKIHLERMMHRNSIAVRGESVASYALIKLIPAAEATPAPPLNLALVLDVSGSMYEEDGTGISRLRRVQQAALAALPKLRPFDALSLVAFAHETAVVLEPTPVVERERIADIIRRVDRVEVDPGGTAMNEGMKRAHELLAQSRREGQIAQMLVLTDGETTGEQECRDLAEKLAQERINLTVMGVGTEWNADLIKDLAKIGEGKWYYIDVEKAEETERIFVEEFGHLAAALFTNVKLHIRPVREVKVKRCRQVAPEIRELQLEQVGERHWTASVGMLERDKPTRYILDLSLPARPDGAYVVAEVEVTYAVGAEPDSTGPQALQVTYSASAPSYVNAEVARHIDEVQIFEMNRNLQEAIASADETEVQRLAQGIEKKAEVMGPRGAKKTMLARQVLSEMNEGGRVSRKTMLAMEDCARLADEMPA
jgi:Ca-activated chloride channel family protein